MDSENSACICEPSARAVLLDTYAWVEFFQGTKKGEKVKSILSSEKCCTSILSIAELVKWCRREGLEPMKLAKTVKENSTILYLNDFIAIGAGNAAFELRKQIKNWGLIDALIYAIGLFYGLTLLTGDEHFNGLEHVEMM
ncbi:MAG: PIN domain-containing protein [Candidatus Micrarchaeota archaeon]